MLPRKLQAGDEVHYLSLLDEQGNTLLTVPMESPVVVPDKHEYVRAFEADVRIALTMTVGGRAL